MYKRNTIIWLSVIFVLAFTGCGYRFPGGGAFPRGVERIFVEVFENNTNETGVENIVTSVLIDEFILREKNSIAGNIKDADSILSGSVARITIHTISARGRDSASERRVTVSLNLNLNDKDGEVIWAAKGLSDDQAYSVSEDRNLTERISKCGPWALLRPVW